MSAYRKDFDETKYVSFLIKDDKLLEKYSYSIRREFQKKEISVKVSYTIRKEFDSNPVYNKKYLRAKIKPYNGKINTNFHNNELPKKGSEFISLSVISIASIFRISKNYCPQVFLGECKYVITEKKFIIILLMIWKFLLILMRKFLKKFR